MRGRLCPRSTALTRAVATALMLVVATSPVFEDERALAGGGPRCFGRPATITGTEGDDRLYGTAGSDVIHGRGGHDDIYASGGNDFICGGSGGVPAIVDGSRTEFLDGEAGRDKIDGGPDSDILTGGVGPDRLLGRGGTLDSYWGDEGDDVLRGGGGIDSFVPGEGRDFAHGGRGRDGASFLDGPVRASLTSGVATGEGRDRLVDLENLGSPEGPGDVLIGNGGANRLQAQGDDLLRGEGGRDLFFVYRGGGASLVGGRGSDTAEFGGFHYGRLFANLAKGRARIRKAHFRLDAIENLLGTGLDDELTGDGRSNKLFGAGGDDTLRGRRGSDALRGGYQTDSAFGGPGRDLCRSVAAKRSCER